MDEKGLNGENRRERRVRGMGPEEMAEMGFERE